MPPGLLMCTITALRARAAEPVERLDPLLIAADEAGDADAGDRRAGPAGQDAQAARAKRSAGRQHGADRKQCRAGAPEGQLAPHPAAIDDVIGIERHGRTSDGIGR